MTGLRDIVCLAGHAHERHRGDYFPGPVGKSPLWRLIHGGDRDAMSKKVLDPGAFFLQERGAGTDGALASGHLQVEPSLTFSK